MNTPIFFNLESDPDLAARLVKQLEAQSGQLEQRRFPDGESYMRIHTDVANQDCIVFCNLDHPDEKLTRLLFLADTLRDMNAARILLVTPYLAHMRHDKRFNEGECLSSRPFARLISNAFDYLITIDPHLHRYNTLDEVYSIGSEVVKAAPASAQWIAENISKPLLIGPDSESEQWVSHVAELAKAPFQVLEKTRHGDFDVEVSLPDVEQWRDHTPVLVDDIISSGRTMLETLKHLESAGLQRPTAIGVHALFNAEAWQALADKADLVTCECVPHPTNAIRINDLLAAAITRFLQHA